MRALTVDDSRVSRRILIGVLRHECGFEEVVEANDGEECLDKVRSGDFDLILMDWNMPKMLGIDAVREIRAMGMQTPIIMVTSERDKEHVIEAIGAGATDYLVKPFSPNAVEKKIRHVVERHRERTARPRTRRALIVDDSPTARNAVRTTLTIECEFEEVTEAQDGAQALEAVKNTSFDLILLDWNMPHMQGIDVLREIRTTDKRTPIIMVTGEMDGPKVVEAFDAGANNYLIKPFKPEALVEKVGQVMRVRP